MCLSVIYCPRVVALCREQHFSMQKDSSWQSAITLVRQWSTLGWRERSGIGLLWGSALGSQGLNCAEGPAAGSLLNVTAPSYKICQTRYTVTSVRPRIYGQQPGNGLPDITCVPCSGILAVSMASIPRISFPRMLAPVLNMGIGFRACRALCSRSSIP